jgi:hypothetical protein
VPTMSSLGRSGSRIEPMVYSSSHLVEQVVGDVAQRSTGAQASELLLHAEESKYKNGTFSIALSCLRCSRSVPRELVWPRVSLK